MTITKRQARELLNQATTPRQRGPQSRFTKEVAAARQKEKKERTGKAWIATARALRALHSDEWDVLYETALEQIHAERGPLPGDE